MKNGFLSKNFPIPKYLKPSYLGISFSDSNIKAIYFDKNLPISEIKSLIVPLDKGSIVEGKIINQKEVINKLSLIRKEFDIDFAFFTIPDELIYIFYTKIPIVPHMDVYEAVAFTIEENIPITLEDSVFDYVPYKIEKSEDGFDLSVVVSACPESEHKNYTDLFNKSGFKILGSVNESQAIANALIKKDSKDTYSIIHARKGRIGTYLVKEGLVHFSTITLVSEENYQEEFIKEYEKFIEYSAKYILKAEDPIKTIFVCGEFEYARKIVESSGKNAELVNNLKLSNVWTNVLEIEKEIPNIKYEDSLNLAGPLGTLLND